MSNWNSQWNHARGPSFTRLEALREVLQTRPRQVDQLSSQLHEDWPVEEPTDPGEYRWSDSVQNEGNEIFNQVDYAGDHHQGGFSLLLKELNDRIEVLENSIDEQKQWNKQLSWALGQLQKALGLDGNTTAESPAGRRSS